MNERTKKSVLLAKVSHGQPENTTIMGFLYPHFTTK